MADEITTLLKTLINKVDGLDERHDNLDSRLDKIQITQVAQAKDIEHHIYRTDLLEKEVHKVDKDIEPIKAHVQHMNGALKFVGILGLTMGLISGALRLFGVI